MQSIVEPTKLQNEDQIRVWFERFIHEINTDYELYKQKMLSPEKDQFFRFISSADEDELMNTVKTSSSKYFIKKLIMSYLTEISNSIYRPNSLAFNISDSKVLVWAIIKDNDENIEDTLIMAEAKINAQFYPKHLYISTTIMEEGDNYPIPPQYSAINFNLLNATI